jgi:hypothetical protein
MASELIRREKNKTISKLETESSHITKLIKPTRNVLGCLSFPLLPVNSMRMKLVVAQHSCGTSLPRDLVHRPQSLAGADVGPRRLPTLPSDLVGRCRTSPCPLRDLAPNQRHGRSSRTTRTSLANFVCTRVLHLGWSSGEEDNDTMGFYGGQP